MILSLPGVWSVPTWWSSLRLTSTMITTSPVTVLTSVKAAGGTTRVRGQTWTDGLVRATTGWESTGMASPTSSAWRWEFDSHDNIYQLLCQTKTKKKFMSDFVSLFIFFIFSITESWQIYLVVIIKSHWFCVKQVKKDFLTWNESLHILYDLTTIKSISKLIYKFNNVSSWMIEQLDKVLRTVLHLSLHKCL